MVKFKSSDRRTEVGTIMEPLLLVFLLYSCIYYILDWNEQRDG